MKKIAILWQDIRWTFFVSPHNVISGSLAVLRLLIWHFFLKKITRYFVGHFQGNYFLFDTQSDGCAQAFITPSYDHAQQELIKNLLSPGSLYFDIGANVGTEVLLALEQGANVHAFEPTKLSYQHLLINLYLNHFSAKWVAQPLAIANRNGNIRFFAFDDGLALKNSAVKSDPHQVEIIVPAQKLDTYLQKNQLSDVDLLKVDVEGAELDVFKGAQKALSKQEIKAIYWESNQMASPAVRQKTREFLTALGYQHFAYQASSHQLVPYSDQEDCLSIPQRFVKATQKILNSN